MRTLRLLISGNIECEIRKSWEWVGLDRRTGERSDDITHEPSRNRRFGPTEAEGDSEANNNRPTYI